MPVPQPYDALLKKLATKTEAGQVNWQETASPNVFVVSLTDYSLVIREWSSDTWDELGGVAVDIRNAKGEKVDTVDVHYRDPDYDWLYQLFVDARRKARNVGAVIDGMLRELESEGAVGKETIPENDDPF